MKEQMDLDLRDRTPSIEAKCPVCGEMVPAIPQGEGAVTMDHSKRGCTASGDEVPAEDIMAA